MTFICQQQSMRRQPSASHIKNSCDRGTLRYLRLICPFGADPKYRLSSHLSPNPVAWISILHTSDGHSPRSVQRSTIVSPTAYLVRGSIACDSQDICVPPRNTVCPSAALCICVSVACRLWALSPQAAALYNTLISICVKMRRVFTVL